MISLPRRPALAALSLALFFVPSALFAQEGDPPNLPKAKPPLVALQESMVATKAEIAAMRETLEEAKTDNEKAELSFKLEKAEAKLHGYELDFHAIATGVDVEGFGLRQRKEFDIAQEFQDLLKPLVEELKQATERPRAIEGLRDDIEHSTKQAATATSALKNIDAALAAETVPGVVAELKKTRVQWEGFLQNATTRISAARSQLEQSLDVEHSTFDTVTEGLKRFVQTRGKYLLVTVATFVGVFLLLRLLLRYLYRVSPWHREGGRSFYSRLIDVVLHTFTFVGALVAAMLVLYATGDWVLLGLAIIFLFGLALAAKDVLPKVYEQARVLLNLGEVREGERVVIDGIPWRVDALGVFTKLGNPLLSGGEMRLPIRSLPELHSRPYCEDEPWFPCEVDEWVILSDDTRGKVVTQSPEMVHMVLLGGSRKSYVTTDFLALAPEVISRNFRVRTVFGVDYGLQAKVTTEIPELLCAEVRRGLLTAIEEDDIQHLKVEFREAGESSLDLEIIADIKGVAASKYETLQRLLQKSAVDACNANGWTIPFPQLTLHQA